MDKTQNAVTLKRVDLQAHFVFELLDVLRTSISGLDDSKVTAQVARLIKYISRKYFDLERFSGDILDSYVVYEMEMPKRNRKPKTLTSAERAETGQRIAAANQRTVTPVNCANGARVLDSQPPN